MKKTAIFVLVLTIATSCFLNAQFFAGGNIGFSTTGGTEDYGNGAQDKTSYLNLDFAPMAGYFLSENLAGGIRMLVSLDKTTTPPYSPGGDETVNSETSIGFTPFIRYYALQVNKLSVFGQAQAGATFGKEKTKVGSTETDGPKTTTISFGVIPGIAFDVNDHVALEAQINLLSFAFSVETEKFESEFTTSKETTRNFDFGVNMDNILTTGAISVGGIFKF